jgi:hypothetical protein
MFVDTAISQPSAEVEVATKTKADARNQAFVKLMPELLSRAAHMSRRHPQQLRSDASADALAAMYLNHAQAFRDGKKLGAATLAFYGAKYLARRSLVTQCRYPSRRGADYVSLDDEFHTPELAERLGRALTTDEKDDPAHLAQVCLDWADFADRQPVRHQRILLGLAEGRRQKEIARRLGISAGRLCQVMDSQLRPEVAAYFGLHPVAGTARG